MVRKNNLLSSRSNEHNIDNGLLCFLSKILEGASNLAKSESAIAQIATGYQSPDGVPVNIAQYETENGNTVTLAYWTTSPGQPSIKFADPKS